MSKENVIRAIEYLFFFSMVCVIIFGVSITWSAVFVVFFETSAMIAMFFLICLVLAEGVRESDDEK